MSFLGKSMPALLKADFDRIAAHQVSSARSGVAALGKPETFKEGVAKLKSILDEEAKIKKACTVIYLGIYELVVKLVEQRAGKRQGQQFVEEECIEAIKDFLGSYPFCFTAIQTAGLKEIVSGNWSEVIASRGKSDETNRKVHKDGDPDRLRLAETVLANRTNRILLVLETPYDMHNVKAVLRTAECFGIQYVYVVRNKFSKNDHGGKTISKGNEAFLTVKYFDSTSDCVKALREEGREIWATDLSPEAIELGAGIGKIVVPQKLALVMGSEIAGCSKEMLAACDKRVYIPLFGFTESLNMSVAAAVLVEYLLLACPEARGNLTYEEKKQLRTAWYLKLASSKEVYDTYYAKFVDNPPPPLPNLRREKDVWIHPDTEVVSAAARPTATEEQDGAEPPAKRLKYTVLPSREQGKPPN